MNEPVFPNGFDSWQKTHFEVVEALCYIRGLHEDEIPKTFGEMMDRTATEQMYQLAKDLTDKYETTRKKEVNNKTFFVNIEDFVSEEVKQLPPNYIK